MAFERVEGFVAAAHVNPDDPPEEMFSAVTSVVRYPDAPPTLKLQMYEGGKPYEDEHGEPVEIELPITTWMFVCRHLQSAVRHAFEDDSQEV